MAFRDVIFRVLAKFDGTAVDRGFRKIKTDSERASESIGKMGRIAGRAFIAIGIAIGASARAFANYEESIVRAGIAIGATEKELESLGEKAREVGRTTQRSAAQAAQGLEVLGLAGFTTKQAMDALLPSVNLAVIANQDVAESTEQVVAILKSFGLEATEAGDVVEQLTFLQANLKVEATELARHMSYAGGAARSLGVDFAEAAAAAGILNESLGERSGVALSALLQSFKKNSKELSAIGVNVYDASGNFRGIIAILRDYEKALEGLNTQQENQLTAVLKNVRAQRGFDALLAQGADKLENLTRATRESTGAVEDFTDKLDKTLSGEFAQLKSAFEELLIIIGEEFKAELVLLIRQIKNLALWLSDSPGHLGYWVKKTLWFTGSFYFASKLVKALILIRTLGIIPLIASFKAARIMAGLFWASATLGASVLITFMPEILTALDKMIAKFAGVDQATKSVNDLELALEKLNARIAAHVDSKPEEIFDGVVYENKEWRRVLDGMLRERVQLGKDIEAARENPPKSTTTDDGLGVLEGFPGEGGGPEDDDDDGGGGVSEGPIDHSSVLSRIRKKKIADETDQEEVEGLAFEQPEGAEDFFGATGKGNVEELNTQERDDLREHLEGLEAEREAARSKDLEFDLKYQEEKRKGATKFELGMMKFQRVMQGERVKGFKDFLGNFIGLAQSGNKALKVIGKAAALIDLGIRIATDVPKAYMQTLAAMAWIPIPGVATGLAVAAAAAVAAQGIAGVKKITAMRHGGIVQGEGGDNSLGDNKVIPALRRGELVIPSDTTAGLLENFREQADAAGEGEGSDGVAGDSPEGGSGSPMQVNVTIDLDGQTLARKVIDITTKEGIFAS